MHLAELDAYHVRVPLRQTVRHASYSRVENDTLFVRCMLSDGATGWGEGLPRPYVTGETIDTAMRQLTASELAQQLDGDMAGLTAAITMLESVRLSGASEAPRDCFGNAARCAVELSVLDAVCRSAGVPLSHVTTLLPETEPIRHQVTHVRYSGAITAMRPRKQILSAIGHRLYSFRQCKVKVGVEGVDDAAMLRRLRHGLGRRMDIRIDANEAWTCANLESKLEPLLPCRISAVEQPVPHAEVGGLARVRDRIEVPIVLDESLCSLSDARRAVDEGLCDLFNIRISKCGGFLNSLRLAGFAHRAGLGYQLGCQVGETGILSAAGRHFATSVGGIRYLEGSFDRHLLAEQFTRPDITFDYGGRSRALDGPGLGIEVDGESIAARAVASQKIVVRR